MPEMNLRTTLIVFALAFGAVACAAVKPLNPGAPQREEPLYPFVISDVVARSEAATATWAQLSTQAGAATNSAPSLQPITATIHSLPNNPGSSFYLPKVGATSVMSDEETRESLRRFFKEWQKLIGADPLQLSLVQELTNADGTKTAVYEQTPFSYPLR